MFSPVPMDIHGHQGLADRIEMHPFSRQAFLETSIGQQRKRPQAGVIPKTAWRLADDFPQADSGLIIEGSLIVMASTRTRLETGCAALIEGMQDIACKPSNQFGHKLVETSANFQNYTPAICR